MRRLLALVAFFAAGSSVLADWATELRAFNEAFRSDHPENRIAAVKSLQEADHAEGAKMLIARFLGEKDAGVQEAIVEALASLRSDRARLAIRNAMLAEGDERRRAALCGILKDGHNLDRADLLKALLADRSERVRIAACGVICPADVSIIPHVARAGSSGSPAGRAAAMEALGRSDSLEAVPALIEALEKETDPDVKKAAIAALVRMSDRNWGDQPEQWQEWWMQQRAKNMPPVDRAIFLGSCNLKPQLAGLLNLPGVRHKPLEGQIYPAGKVVPLLVYALHHAGIPNEDPVMVAAVAFMKSCPLDYNYSATMQALALADMDSRAHATRLYEIAQWLADTQCENGQWSYGLQSPYTPTQGEPVQTGPRFRVVWRDCRRYPEGDGSNTQFSILALRAALDAGIEIPAIVWQRSLDWYVKGQTEGGGWGYSLRDLRAGAYHSMTCSGLCAVTICLRALGRDAAFRNGKPETEPMIGKGLDWLANEGGGRRRAGGRGGWGVYYDLYSLERVGMILGLEKIGDRDWYEDGVATLLPLQDPGGSWGKDAVDTAFAILFLRRATRGYPSDPKDK